MANLFGISEEELKRRASLIRGGGGGGPAPVQYEPLKLRVPQHIGIAPPEQQCMPGDPGCQEPIDESTFSRVQAMGMLTPWLEQSMGDLHTTRTIRKPGGASSTETSGLPPTNTFESSSAGSPLFIEVPSRYQPGSEADAVIHAITSPAYIGDAPIPRLRLESRSSLQKAIVSLLDFAETHQLRNIFFDLIQSEPAGDGFEKTPDDVVSRGGPVEEKVFDESEREQLNLLIGHTLSQLAEREFNRNAPKDAREIERLKQKLDLLKKKKRIRKARGGRMDTLSGQWDHVRDIVYINDTIASNPDAFNPCSKAFLELYVTVIHEIEHSINPTSTAEAGRSAHIMNLTIAAAREGALDIFRPCHVEGLVRGLTVMSRIESGMSDQQTTEHRRAARGRGGD